MRLGYARGIRSSVWLPAYGVAVAVVSMALLGSHARWPVTPVRAYFLNSTTAVQRAGGPPLLALGTTSTPGHAVFVPSGAGDDAGSYVVAPALARAFGLTNGVAGLKLLFQLMFGIGLALYPLLFKGLTGSDRAALLAPLGLLAALLLVVGNADVYWVSAWAPLVLGPALIYVALRRPRGSPLWLAAIALAASLATSLRNPAGLGIALGCLAAAMVVCPGWRTRAAASALIVAAYLAITPAAIALVQHQRDAQLTKPLVAGSASASHLFWHPLYLGLGFLPNKYGIHWDDAVAIARARSVDPSVEYPAAGYDAAVRRLFTRQLRRDPVFVARVEAQKAVVAVAGAPFVTVLALLAACLLGLLERRWLYASLLLAPTAVLGIAAGVVGMPDREYTQAWLSSAALVVILACCLAAGNGDRLTGWRELGLRRRTAALVAAACLLVVAGNVYSRTLHSRCMRWQPSSSATGCGGYEFQPPLRT